VNFPIAAKQNLKRKCHKIIAFVKVLEIKTVLFEWTLMVFTISSCRFVKKMQKFFCAITGLGAMSRIIILTPPPSLPVYSPLKTLKIISSNKVEIYFADRINCAAIVWTYQTRPGKQTRKTWMRSSQVVRAWNKYPRGRKKRSSRL
jgi:hypothetical protein